MAQITWEKGNVPVGMSVKQVYGIFFDQQGPYFFFEMILHLSLVPLSVVLLLPKICSKFYYLY